MMIRLAAHVFLLPKYRVEHRDCCERSVIGSKGLTLPFLSCQYYPLQISQKAMVASMDALLFMFDAWPIDRRAAALVARVEEA